MRLFLLMCLAAVLIAGVISKKGNKKNTGVNAKLVNRKNTIAGFNSKNRNRGRKDINFGRKYPNYPKYPKYPWKENTKFVRKEGDWNIYETRPDKQLEPMNVNSNLGAEIVIPRNEK